jgi:SagB-type dehydrogenase family enzyme
MKALDELRTIKRRILGAGALGYCPACMEPKDAIDRYRNNVRKEPDKTRRELLRMYVTGVLGASLPLLVRDEISLQACGQPPTTTYPPATTTRPSTSVQETTTPPSTTWETIPLEDMLTKRRSIREYADKPLTIEQVMQLLWAAQGITLEQYGFRTAPSAGGTYPLEIYLVTKRSGVESLEPGIYHYEPREHRLVRRIEGDFSAELMAAALDQDWVGMASANLVITAVFDRTTRKYGERGVRYVWQETGHAAQNIYLQAVALGLGNVVVGAFHDSEVQRILGVPEQEKPAYVIPVGVPRTSR